jgi:hypothetical protein
MLAGSLSAETLLRGYCTLVFAATGNYQETSRRLGIDRRTVKDKVDPEFLQRLQADGNLQLRGGDNGANRGGAMGDRDM